MVGGAELARAVDHERQHAAVGEGGRVRGDDRVGVEPAVGALPRTLRRALQRRELPRGLDVSQQDVVQPAGQLEQPHREVEDGAAQLTRVRRPVTRLRS